MSPRDLAAFDDAAGQPASSPIQQPQYRAYKHHRRTSSTGGGRAWTEEEEAYLLRTRMQKMPYKHIAAHLKKTELACRLHYHQMSYGNNGRRRTDSISSTISLNSVATSRATPENTHHTQLSPVPSPSRSPEIGLPRWTADDKLSCPQQRAHVPILPKQDARYTLLPRLDTYMTPSGAHNSPETEKPVLDYARVLALYESHRESFWSRIAAEYSHDPYVSGHAMERAFFHSLSLDPARLQSPPTPRPSPVASPEPQSQSCPDSVVYHRGFQAVNSAYGSMPSTKPSSADICSVSALLAEEREVRPPRERLEAIK